MSRWLKRLLFGLLGVSLLLGVAVAGLLLATFYGHASLRDGERPLPFVDVIQDGHVSCDLVDMGQGKLALIDACNDYEARAILRRLKAQKRDPRQVVAVFLTHGHPDHTAALYTLMHARIYGLAREAALVGGRRQNRGPLTRYLTQERTGLEISHPLRDGDVVRVGNRDVHVFAVPGHTAGSAAFYIDGALFLGDSADAASDGSLLAAKWLFTDDGAQNRASLRRLEKRLRDERLNVQRLVFGHTGSLAGGGPLQRFTAD